MDDNCTRSVLRAHIPESITDLVMDFVPERDTTIIVEINQEIASTTTHCHRQEGGTVIATVNDAWTPGRDSLFISIWNHRSDKSHVVYIPTNSNGFREWANINSDIRLNKLHDTVILTKEFHGVFICIEFTPDPQFIKLLTIVQRDTKEKKNSIMAHKLFSNDIFPDNYVTPFIELASWEISNNIQFTHMTYLPQSKRRKIM